MEKRIGSKCKRLFQVLICAALVFSLAAGSVTAADDASSSGGSSSRSSSSSKAKEESSSEEKDSASDTADAALKAKNAKRPAGWPEFQEKNSDTVKKWREINNKVYAWLEVPGTNINYPVTQGKNNDEYMSKGYFGEYDTYSTIWADYRVKFGDRGKLSSNTVLYGHNWVNYSAKPKITDPSHKMFDQLTSYHYLSFAKKNQFIYYSTADGDYVFQIFACFYTDMKFNYAKVNVGKSKLKTIVDEAKERSLHDFDVAVDGSRKIITLSTCTRAYGRTNQQRFVVMGQLLKAGETPKNAKVTANKDFKKPNI